MAGNMLLGTICLEFEMLILVCVATKCTPNNLKQAHTFGGAFYVGMSVNYKSDTGEDFKPDISSLQ